MSFALLTIGLMLGVMMASLAFATPLGEIDIWRNNFNFIMSFLCLALIFPVVVLLSPKKMNIVASSVVGSYMFLLGLDYFMGSGFDDILFNVFKRLTSSWFSQNYSGNYFGAEFNGCTDADLNLAMLAAWIILSILTSLLQYYFTGAGLDFPESPRKASHTRLRTTMRTQVAGRRASFGDVYGNPNQGQMDVFARVERQVPPNASPTRPWDRVERRGGQPQADNTSPGRRGQGSNHPKRPPVAGANKQRGRMAAGGALREQQPYIPSASERVPLIASQGGSINGNAAPAKKNKARKKKPKSNKALFKNAPRAQGSASDRKSVV